MEREKLVIIGNGMAAGRALEELLRARARSLRRHDLQRRAARQLRPHHAVAGAVGREEPSRTSSSTATAGTQARHHAPQGPRGRQRSTATAQTVTSDNGMTVALRQAGHRHRLRSVHHSGARARLPGVLTYPRSRRRRTRCSPPRKAGGTRGGDRRRPARASKRPPACAQRHGRHRRPSHADADGAPARCGRRLSAAAAHRGARHRA